MQIREDDVQGTTDTERKIFRLGFDHAMDKHYDILKTYMASISNQEFNDRYRGWNWQDIILDMTDKARDWKSQQL